MSGVLAGLASWMFLEGLDRVTEFRIEHPWIVWFLPFAGLAIGLAYHFIGGRSAEGNDLLIDEIHEPTAWVPTRMAPLVLVGTWITHLFGGSAGREGVAMQMSGSLSDGLAHLIGLRPDDRRMLLIAALGGGFGAVFGVPLAGAVFALEVQCVGRVRYDALVPTLTASLVGDLVVHGLGYHHPLRPQLHVPIDGWLWLRIAVAGICFGLVAVAVRRGDPPRGAPGHEPAPGWPPFRPVARRRDHPRADRVCSDAPTSGCRCRCSPRRSPARSVATGRVPAEARVHRGHPRFRISRAAR